MSMTAARTTNPRISPTQLIVAALAALALLAVLVMMSVSGSASGVGRASTPSVASAPLIQNVASGHFRDPVTHALTPHPAASVSYRDTPGQGHK